MMTSGAGINIDPVAAQAEALLNSYSHVRDEVARLEHDARDDAVSTVMGAAEIAGTYDVSTAKNFVAKDDLLAQLLEANPQKDAILTRIGQVGAAISAATAGSTVKKAAQLIDSDVLGPVLARAQNIVKTANDSRTNAQTLATVARKATGRISDDRAQAELTFTKDMDMLKKQMAVCNDITTTLSSLDGDLQAVMCGAADALTKSDQTKRLGTLRMAMIDQRNAIINGLIDHMNGQCGNFGSAAKSDGSDLKGLDIPKNLRDGTGEALIDAVMVYLRGRAKKYYAIIPMLRRIAGDLDASTGTYFQPPTMSDNGYASIDKIFRSVFTSQSREFFDEIWVHLSEELRLLLMRTFNYGVDQQLKFKCPEHDGVSAFFALLSQFRPQGANYRDQLETHFEEASEHFSHGNPLGKIEFLRTKLKEVSRLGVKLRWNKTGKLVVLVLGRLDTEYSDALKDWKNASKVSDLEDCAGDIEVLFNDIETAHAEILTADALIKGGKQWRSHLAVANGADARGPKDANLRECKFGMKCIKDGCWFGHPSGWSAEKARANKSKGKDKRANYGRESKDDNCVAKGCTRSGKGKKFCTPCFKQGIEKGSLELKAGGLHKFRSAGGKHERDGDKSTKSDEFGFERFSKKQKFGVKQAMMVAKRQAVKQYIDSKPSEDDEGAFNRPVQSVSDRLEALEIHADRAFAKKRKTIEGFLEDIDQQ